MPDLDFLIELGPQIEISLIDRALGGRSSGSALGSAAFAATLARDVCSSRRPPSSVPWSRPDFRGIAAEGFVAEAGGGGGAAPCGRFPAWTCSPASARRSRTSGCTTISTRWHRVSRRLRRTAFDADGGYLGTDLFIGAAVQPRIRTLRVFVGVQSGFYGGAANEDSPLFETSANTGVALGVPGRSPGAAG